MDNLTEILRLHKLWLDNDPAGQRADLREANLRGADLREANLDFACWPLWCGSLGARLDETQITQLLYHVLSVVTYSEVSDDFRSAILTEQNVVLANQFHRADDCGVLEGINETTT